MLNTTSCSLCDKDGDSNDNSSSSSSSRCHRRCCCCAVAATAARYSEAATTALQHYCAYCMTQTAAFLCSLSHAMQHAAALGEQARVVCNGDDDDVEDGRNNDDDKHHHGNGRDNAVAATNAHDDGDTTLPSHATHASCNHTHHHHHHQHQRSNHDGGDTDAEASDTLLTLLSDVGDTTTDDDDNDDDDDDDGSDACVNGGDGDACAAVAHHHHRPHDNNNNGMHRGCVCVDGHTTETTAEAATASPTSSHTPSRHASTRHAQRPPTRACTSSCTASLTSPSASTRRGKSRKAKWKSRLSNDLRLCCDAAACARSTAAAQSTQHGSLPALCGGIVAEGAACVVLESSNHVLAYGRVSRVYTARLRVVPYDATAPTSEDNFDMRVAVKVWYVNFAHVGGAHYFHARIHHLVHVSHPAIVRYFALGIAPLTRSSRSSNNSHDNNTTTTAAATCSSSLSSTSTWSPDASMALALPSHARDGGDAVVVGLRCAIVMEHADGGSLDALVKRSGGGCGLSEDDIRAVLHDILPALRYMHETIGYVHNDVKPHNILLFTRDDDNDDNDDDEVDENDDNKDGSNARDGRRTTRMCHRCRRFRHKLVDFASADAVQSTAATRAQLRQPRARVLQQSAQLTVFTGTAAFMSPESCLGVTRHAGNDVWSLGITLFYLATGRVPWYALEMSNPELILHGYRARFAAGQLFADLTDHDDNDVAAATTHAMTATTTTPCSHDGRHRMCRDDKDTTSNSSGSSSGSSDGSACGGSHASACHAFGPVLGELDDGKYSRELVDFVRVCLTEHPLRRPTCAQLMQHAFYTMAITT